MPKRSIINNLVLHLIVSETRLIVLYLTEVDHY
jgi:hypothetical protein